MNVFWFRMLAALAMFLPAVFGLIFNILVIMASLKNTNLGSIFKICIVKAFSNIIICGGFIIWPIPCAILNYYFLPKYFNVLMGQIIGWFAVTLGPLTQVLLAGNRFVAVYSPRIFGTIYRVSPTSIGIGISFLVASIAAIAGFFEGCHFLFIVETLGWMPENSPCGLMMTTVFTTMVFGMALVSNSFNIATFVKLFFDSKKVNLSNTEFLMRQMKNRRMLSQSVLHDLLILVDMCNSIFLCRVNDAAWFQFLTMSFSLVFIRMLEGLIMLLINERIKDGVRLILRLRTKMSSNFSSHHSEPVIMFVKSVPNKMKY